MYSLIASNASLTIVFLVCLICLIGFGMVWAVEGIKRSSNAGRRSRLEYLEARLPLDSQIGTVTMPYDGYLSAAIYDSNGQIIRTLLAQVPEQAGSVPLIWDGKDQLGRTVIQNGTYTWKALTSQVNPLDQGAVGDTEMEPTKFDPNQGYHVQSLAASNISGTSGDVGGTFARNDHESYFGDTSLSQNYTLETAISASGTFSFSDVVSMKGKFFIGHFSSAATGTNDREFIGIEFTEGDFDEAINARARIFRFNGDFSSDALSSTLALGINTGYYNWSYNYDPTFEADGGHAGPEGRLAIRIWNNAGLDQTLYAINDGTHRDAGSTFNAFGMGISTMEHSAGDDPTATAKLFIDDVTYSGNVGLVNFSSNPGWVGVGNTSDGNNYVWNSYSNADGGLIMASYLEEGFKINKIAADGTWEWVNNGGHNFGVAVDETYVYTTRNILNQDRLYRNFARGGASALFAPGVEYIVINSSAPDTLPPGRLNFHYTPEEWHTLAAAWGIATDGYRVWVSNYRNNSLMVYDRNTGTLLGQTALTKPLGIAVDTANSGSGTVWVANNGDRLTKITFNGSFSTSTTITGLSDPTGVAIGGPSHHLFVAESGHSHIHEYDISGTPVLAGWQTFGSKHLGGPLADNQFYWINGGNVASLAIDPSGILSVTDDHRVQQFYTVTGGGHTAGELKNSLASDFVPSPVQAYNFTANGKHYLVSNRYVYEVDPNYTGGPRTGWVGDGSWRLVERYYWGIGEDNWGPGVRRTIMDGGTPRELLYLIAGNTIVAYMLDATGQQRQAAIVGSQWTGPDRMNTVPFNPENGIQLGGRYNWTDTDGDGAVDWNGVGSGTDGEVVWNIPYGQNSLLNAVPWIDEAGNIWTIENNSIIKVPFEGFVNSSNGKRNPVYNWANKVTVVPFQNDSTGFFAPVAIRIAGNGDIYALGGTNHPEAGTFVAWHGGNWFARYNSAGVRQFLAPTVDEWYAALSVDMTDSDPDYFIGGGGSYSDIYTKDGLLLTRFTNGAGTGGPTGWMDHPYSIGMFTHPVTGQMFVYAENSYYGNATRWRIDNLNTVQRQENTFSYTASTALGGRWEFESNLNDAAGSNTGTFSGGSPAYATGQIGNAINLDGVDDGIQVPYAADFNGYTISAWVKADTTSGGRNIISRSASDPNAASHQIFINSSGKFSHYTIDNLGGKFITGTTTVATGTWYHVAITASNGGLARLYVNGVEEGTAASLGSLWGGGDRFNIGRSNNQAGFFDGLVDDVRIYDVSLSQTDIQTIFNKTDKPTVSVTATDTTAAEETADKGTFLIRRDNSAGNLTVNYTITGTATNSTDYTSIAGSVTIPSGSTSVVVTVTPSSDAAVEGNETVILTISTGANYTIGSGSLGNATVNIVDNDSTTVPPNGRWAFEDTIPGNGTGHEFGLSDYAGSNNGIHHGTAYFDSSFIWDGPAIYATGLIGKAVSLDGLNNNVTVPYSNDATAYTIMARVKPMNLGGNVIARTDATLPNINGIGTISEQIRINSSGKFEHFTNDGSGKTVTGTTTVTLGNWYHVAIVANNSGMMRLYVNGVEEGTAQSIGTLWTGGDRFNLGTNVVGAVKYQGLIDDLQIYDAPLTASQIQAVYNQTSTVTVSASDPNAAEPSDTGTFTITRTTTSGSVVVNYTISGTATSGTDFSSLAGSVTIANGSSTATVTVTPIDDSTAESNETVVLTIASNPNYSVGSPNSASVTLADNEATVTVSSPDSSASEQGPDAGTIVFSRNNTSGNLVINFTKTGTATNSTDYTSIANSVTILSGQTTATVTVTPVDDAVVEGDETVIFTISSSGGYTIGSPNSATVTIADNEPTITVTASDPSAAESAADVGKFTITRTNTNGNLTVNYTLAGTATNNSDYSTLAGSVTIPNGSTSVTVTVTPIDDSTAEGDETVILTLSTNASYTVGTPNNATLTILDNEPTVSVSAVDANASEQGSDTGTFVLTRVGNTSGNLVVNFTKNGTATNGTDYTSIVNSVTILSGQSTATVTVTPTDDSTAEGNETVVLTISSSANYFVGSPNNATVMIADNESTVSVIATDANAAEQGTDPGLFVFSRTNTTGDLVVNFTKSGTATNSTDYTSIANSVTILNGQSTATVTVTPVDDSAAEGSETVTLTISSSSNYFIGAPSSDTVTIADNESTVTISATDAAAAEQGANTGVVTVTRTNTSGNLVVNFTKTGTATNGTDYSSIAGSVTILSGSATASVTVTPIDDATAEGNETVIFTISSSSSYFIGTPDSATVTIADNDAVVAGQVGGTFVRNDNESYFADTTLSQSYTLNSTITASGLFSAQDAAAMIYNKLFVGHFSSSTANDRREFMGMEFVQGATQATIGIRARIYQYNGSAVDGASSGEIYLPTGSGYYYFDYTYDPNYNADGGSPEGRLALHIYNDALTVNTTIYATNTASQRALGATYDAFGMGIATQESMTGDDPTQTAKVFIDDVTYSGNTGTVDFNTDPGWVGVGNISDSNSYGWNLVSVTSTDTSASEQGSDVGKFTISRATSTGNLTVFYTLTGTAVNGSDYSALSGSVVIPDGQTSATVTVTPIDDNLAESSEAVVLTIASNAAYTIGTPSGASLTIADNEATVTVTASDASAAEPNNAGTFTITRTNTNGNLTVNYTINGTATSGTDYSALSGSVIIPNGQLSAAVMVNPIDDSTTEGDETVTLTISSSANHFVGMPNNATVTIADNDGVVAGQVGGTFARNDNESYFADTVLSPSSYTLSSSLTASGLFSAQDAAAMIYNKLFVGHFSSSTASNQREFMGMEFVQGATSAMIGIRARIYQYNGSAVDGASSGEIYLPTSSEYYHFDYTYDPNYNADGGSPEGRLALHIYNDALTINTTIYAVNSASQRALGATYDAFGMGIATQESMTGDDPTQNAKVFIDDVTYTGNTGVVNFNSDPGWVGVGNTTDGNNYRWVQQNNNVISVVASDANAAEQATDPGTFTISRGVNTGDVTVYYTLSGTATNVSDYGSIAGSVTILNGQTSATVTVTPINDAVAEGNETVILTIATDANYSISAPGNATVTIADNDAFVQAQVGGTFARNDNESYYGDTTLSQSYTLNSSITASGLFFAQDAETTLYNKLFVGHFSSSTANDRREFMGMEFVQGATQATIGIRARIYQYNGSAVDGASSGEIYLPTGSGYYHFDYTYDPNYNADGGSPEGRLALHIYNDALTVNTTIYATNTASQRALGATYDAFGMGIATQESMTGDDPTQNVKVFIDDVTYSGNTGTVNFNSDPGWIGTGNNSDGNNYGWNHQLAHDGFETNSTSGGTGWAAAWTLTGNAAITTTGTAKTGSYHLQLTGNNGVASRAVNLSGVTAATLSFDWKANSFEAGETAVVEIYNGTSWVTVQTVTDGQDDNAYHHSDIDLSGYTLGSSFQVRFRSLMSASDDFFYIDNLQIAM